MADVSSGEAAASGEAASGGDAAVDEDSATNATNTTIIANATNATSSDPSSSGRRLFSDPSSSGRRLFQGLWDGPSAGHTRWMYSEARQAYEAQLLPEVSTLLQLPARRVVLQGTRVNAADGTVDVYAWLLDLGGDPSSIQRPAPMVQSYVREWIEVCDARDGGAPPAPPPPPPSAPPSPLPPNGRRSPPPYWLRTYATGLASMQQEATVPLSALADESAVPPPPPPAFGLAGLVATSPPPPPPPGMAPGLAALSADGGGAAGGTVSASGAAAPVFGASVSGEPAGSLRATWPCPVYVGNALLLTVSDATPPSPPASPPPPPPPSPPSPPPSPPYIECAFIACEVLSDEEVERREALAILEGSVSSAARSQRRLRLNSLRATHGSWTRGHAARTAGALALVAALVLAVL